MWRRLLLFFILCIIVNCGLFAEEDDFGVWTFLGLNKKLSGVVSLYGEAELRLREEAAKVDCWSLYGEVSAKICPFLRGGGGYTFIKYDHPSTSWESRHRFNVFMIDSYSFGNCTLALRERYEQVHRILVAQSFWSPKRTLRSRLECTYKIANSVFIPYSTVELYTALNEPNGVMNDKMRYTIGTLLGVGTHHSLSVYYRYVEAFHSASVSFPIFRSRFPL